MNKYEKYLAELDRREDWADRSVLKFIAGCERLAASPHTARAIFALAAVAAGLLLWVLLT